MKRRDFAIAILAGTFLNPAALKKVEAQVETGMSYVVVVSDTFDTEAFQIIMQKTADEEGGSCYVLNNACVIKTNSTAEQINKTIQEIGILTNKDRYFVASLAEEWAAYNCDTAGECFG